MMNYLLRKYDGCVRDYQNHKYNAIVTEIIKNWN